MVGRKADQVRAVVESLCQKQTLLIAVWARAGNTTTVPVSKLPVATTDAAGISERATAAEVQAGVDDIRYVSPLRLKDEITRRIPTGGGGGGGTATTTALIYRQASNNFPVTDVLNDRTVGLSGFPITSLAGNIEFTVETRSGSVWTEQTPWVGSVASLPTSSSSATEFYSIGSQGYRVWRNASNILFDYRLDSGTRISNSDVRIANIRFQVSLDDNLEDFAITTSTEVVPNSKMPTISVALRGAPFLATGLSDTRADAVPSASQVNSSINALSGTIQNLEVQRGVTETEIETFALNSSTDLVPADKLPTANISRPGIVELTNNSELIGGTDNEKYISPLALRSELNRKLEPWADATTSNIIPVNRLPAEALQSGGGLSQSQVDGRIVVNVEPSSRIGTSTQIPTGRLGNVENFALEGNSTTVRLSKISTSGARSGEVLQFNGSSVGWRTPVATSSYRETILFGSRNDLPVNEWFGDSRWMDRLGK